MKKFIYDFNIKDKYILNNFSNYIALDIETTGFSREKDSIISISTCEIKENSKVKILFAEDLKDEIDILNNIDFNEKKIITYNGDSFDVPFINKRKKIYNIQLDNAINFDLYKYILNYKYLLNLDNYKQKTIEEHLNLERSEFISGGEIVKKYREYLISKDSSLIEEMVIHNRDDVLGLVQSLKIVEELNDKLTLKVNSDIFNIDKIKMVNNYLIVEGSTSIADSILFNLFNYELAIENNLFTIKIETQKALYDNINYCNFILKKNFFNIENKSSIPSPEEILILSVNGILYDNVYNLIFNILKNTLN